MSCKISINDLKELNGQSREEISDFIKVKDKSEYDAILNEFDVRTDIKVGGKDESTGGKFTPNINMQKWGGECWLNINHPDTVSDQKPDFTPNKIELRLNNKIHRYKILDRSRIEYEIDFLQKPATPVIRLNLDFPDGLQFFLQPELTQLEKEQGAERPENVIDSYAVYCKKRNNKYKTGKFCHIYRIRATDSYGIWTWCKQQIAGKEWIITIPTDFWTNAVYPITLDPILGYSTPGSSQWGASTIKMGSNDDTDANGGDIQKFHIAVQARIAPAMVKICVHECDQADGNPENFSPVEQVEFEVNISDDEWIDAPIGESLSGNTKYIVVFHVDNSNTKIKFDSGGSGWYSAGIYANSFEDPWPQSCTSIARLNGVWVDYEPAGPEISFTPNNFNFEATQGGENPENQILEIWNSGAGTLSWNVDDDADWLDENPKSGESTGEHDEVTVSVDITGLEGGIYNATITITAPGASNTPQTVPVQLTINSASEFIEIIEGDSIIIKQIDGDSTITKMIDEKSTITKLIDEESPLNG